MSNGTVKGYMERKTKEAKKITDVQEKIRDFTVKRTKMADRNRNTRKREADAFYEGYALGLEEMEGFVLERTAKEWKGSTINMTVAEYNEKFLPLIDTASILVNNLENALRKTEDYEGAMEQLKCLGWSSECINTIQTALDFYQQSVVKQLK